MSRYISVLAAVAGIILGAGLLSAHTSYEGIDHPNGWPLYGQNKENTHFASREHIIGPNNVGQLYQKWVYNTDAQGVVTNGPFPLSVVAATPAVDSGSNAIYFPDINGRLHAVNAKTGQKIWVKNIVTDYLQDYVADINSHSATTGITVDINKVQAFTHATPAIYKNMLIFGVRATSLDNPSNFLFPHPGYWVGMPNLDSALTLRGGVVIAVDRNTGALLWKTRVSTSPLGAIVASVSVYKGIVYGGVSGFFEETATPGSIDIPTANTVYNYYYNELNSMNNVLNPNNSLRFTLPETGFTCCGFVGSAFALDANNKGKLLWNTPTIDRSAAAGFNGWSGASIWGSAAAIDPGRGLVYMASGNLFNSATNATSCLITADNNPAARNACKPTGVHDESVLAFDMKTGALKMFRKVVPAQGLDTFGVSCALGVLTVNPTLCSDPYELTFGGNLGAYFNATGTDVDFGQSPMLVDNNGTQILVVGQKSGAIIAMNPSNLSQDIWPPVYDSVNGVVVGGTTGGHEWGMATDGITIFSQNTNSNHIPVQFPGEVAPLPGGFFSAISLADGHILWQTRDPNSLNPSLAKIAQTYGALTLANGVLYGTSLSHELFALNAQTGAILWSKSDLPGAGFAAPAVAKGVIYWPVGWIIGSNPGLTSADYNPYDNRIFAFTVPNGPADSDNDSSAVDDDNDN